VIRLGIVLTLTIGLGLGLTACGDDNSASSATTTTSVAASNGAPSASTSTLDPKAQQMLDEINKRGKPTVTVPPAPATELKVTDLVVGTGATAEPTSTVLVHYVGVGQQSGKEFDSSWSRGQPISFPLNQVIPGWSQGMVGMKEGGRRELVIPGALAYGANPPTPDIQPNETLVFVVDLIAVQ
jgi:peptidylprolyl isomerase